MRVLLLHHDAGWGGAENSFRLLARGLRNEGISPILALPNDGPLFRRLRNENFPVTRVPLRVVPRPRGVSDAANSLLYLSRAVPRVARLARNSGATILHSNSTNSHLVGAWSAALIGIPAIWHVRDLAPLGPLAPILAKRAARVLAISQSVGRFLISEGVPREKIVVVPNALDLNEWQPREFSSLRAELNLPEGTFLFGAVGQMVGWKNLAAFVEAAELLNDEPRARFVLVGRGPEEANLRASVRGKKLGKRFHFVAPRADAADVLSAFDCLVHPSECEPFGRVLIEAMALEKPVIAVNKAGPREIIHSSTSVLVENGAPDELAGAMRHVLEHEDEACSLGQRARQTVAARFSLEAQSRRMRIIYQEVV